MGVENVRPPVLAQSLDRGGKRGDLAPFAQAGGSVRLARRAMETQPVDILAGRPVGRVPQPGDPARIQAHRHLRLQNRAGAKGVTAMHRQRMIEDV